MPPRLRRTVTRCGYGERAGVSTGADTKANARGGGALEVEDHRLLEDGSQLRGALRSDIISPETVRDGWRHSVSRHVNGR